MKHSTLNKIADVAGALLVIFVLTFIMLAMTKDAWADTEFWYPGQDGSYYSTNGKHLYSDKQGGFINPQDGTVIRRIPNGGYQVIMPSNPTYGGGTYYVPTVPTIESVPEID